MVITDRLVWQAFPKSASTTVWRLLEELGIGSYTETERELTRRWSGSPGRHVPASLIPSDLLRGRKVWSTVRDPLSWLVSYFFHFKDHKHLGQFAEHDDLVGFLEAAVDVTKADGFDPKGELALPFCPWRIPWADLEAAGGFWPGMLEVYGTRAGVSIVGESAGGALVHRRTRDPIVDRWFVVKPEGTVTAEVGEELAELYPERAIGIRAFSKVYRPCNVTARYLTAEPIWTRPGLEELAQECLDRSAPMAIEVLGATWIELLGIACARDFPGGHKQRGHALEGAKWEQ